MSTLLESRLSPQQRAQACAADAAEAAAEAAMRNLRRAQAERATLNSAGQAIDAAMRPCFDIATGVYPGLCGDLRAEVDAEEGVTSLQPLGDAQVMVVYSRDSNNSLTIDGATINGEFVSVDNFSTFVRGQWEKALRSEERKAAEIESWGGQ